MSRILITGAFGQIGTELTRALRRQHGPEAVLATGPSLPEDGSAQDGGPAARLDVTDRDAIAALLRDQRADTVYHLAALLSATSERHPQRAWEVNMTGLYNMLEAARETHVQRLFWPSSIAVFGPTAPRDHAPQETALRPITIYGVAKVAGELLCDYYVKRYGLDVRGVRYPGVISSGTPPGGGTTDYAVEMFYAALDGTPYTCFVGPDTVLPMIYMPDCIKAAVDLMSAPADGLTVRNGFNLAAMSFSARELADEIARHVPGFVCRFEPDARQAIADSWPRSLDDRPARQQWGWRPDYGLPDMTVDMLTRVRTRTARGQ